MRVEASRTSPATSERLGCGTPDSRMVESLSGKRTVRLIGVAAIIFVASVTPGCGGARSRTCADTSCPRTTPELVRSAEPVRIGERRPNESVRGESLPSMVNPPAPPPRPTRVL